MSNFEIKVFNQNINILNVFLAFIAIVSSIICRRGIVPPSVVVLYCTFLCWSSLMSFPDKSCNLFKMNEATDIAFQIVTSVIVSVK